MPVSPSPGFLPAKGSRTATQHLGEHSSGVMVRLTAGSFTGVLVPMRRLNSTAALSGLRAALL